ncbi:hypothetical protein ACWC0A_18055 [Streptomyces scopuliridis]
MSSPADPPPDRLMAVPSALPWAVDARPCVHCAIPTHRRDTAGRPAHPICTTRTETGP